MVDSNYKDYEGALKLRNEYSRAERADVLEFAEKILVYLGYGVIALIGYNLLKD